MTHYFMLLVGDVYYLSSWEKKGTLPNLVSSLLRTQSTCQSNSPLSPSQANEGLWRGDWWEAGWGIWHDLLTCVASADLGGGFLGLQPPPNGQSHNMKCSIKLGSQYDARPCIVLCRAGKMWKYSIFSEFFMTRRKNSIQRNARLDLS